MSEFLSGEQSIGFCLDKAQLSGRPRHIQDCPELQEALVGQTGWCFPPCSLFLLWGISANAESACVVSGGSFSPMAGWRHLGAALRYRRHQNLPAFMSPTLQETAARPTLCSQTEVQDATNHRDVPELSCQGATLFVLA